MDFQKSYELGLAWYTNFLYTALSQTEKLKSINNTLLDSKQPHVQNGVSQGSVISPTLFTLMMNNLVRHSHKISTIQYFYADNGSVVVSTMLAHKLQPACKQQQTYMYYTAGSKTGVLRYHNEKTVRDVFGKKRLHTTFNNTCKSNCIKFQNQGKCLGVTLNQQLNQKKHKHQLEAKCEKVLNLLCWRLWYWLWDKLQGPEKHIQCTSPDQT